MSSGEEEHSPQIKKRGRPSKSEESPRKPKNSDDDLDGKHYACEVSQFFVFWTPLPIHLLFPLPTDMRPGFPPQVKLFTPYAASRAPGRVRLHLVLSDVYHRVGSQSAQARRTQRLQVPHMPCGISRRDGLQGSHPAGARRARLRLRHMPDLWTAVQVDFAAQVSIIFRGVIFLALSV